jgi:hypothetical protein
VLTTGFRYLKQATLAATRFACGTVRMRRSSTGVRWKSPLGSGSECQAPWRRMQRANASEAV